jgi:dnaJ domain protein
MPAKRGQTLDNRTGRGRADSAEGRENSSTRQTVIIEDYYTILNISPSASIAEIKRAFRKKAKELHPDIPHNVRHTGRKKSNEQALLQLIRAYEALLDAKRRAEFDVFYNKAAKKTESFDYRTWLKEQTDTESKAMLIFFDLFHNAEDEAVEEFLRLRVVQPSFSLRRFFNRGDFMDCGFVLAEELSFRNHYYEAFVLLEQIIREEQKQAYFRHFFPEVLILARKLIREKLIYMLADDLILDCCEAALDFGLSKADNAEILKKMAEIYYRMGDFTTGDGCAAASVRMNPRIRGIATLKKNYQQQLWR